MKSPRASVVSLFLLVTAGPVAPLFCATAFGAEPSAPSGLPIADGAADARQDFADGVLMLLGGEGLEPGTLELGEGLELEIVTDACSLGPDPAGYTADYNQAMKASIRAAHGIDVDEVLLRAAP